MKHLIIVKYNSLVEDRDAFADEALNLFGKLTQYEGIHSVRVIKGIPVKENRYDLIIEINMEMDALSFYNDSEVHKKWLSDYAKYIDKKAIFDCEEEI